MSNYPSPELTATRERAVARYLDGAETRELADLYAVSQNTIRQWLKLAGVAVRRQPRIPDGAVEKARQLIADGASRCEAARTVGCSPESLRRYGLPGWGAEEISEHISLIKSSAYRALSLTPENRTLRIAT